MHEIERQRTVGEAGEEGMGKGQGAEGGVDVGTAEPEVVV
jgi:hypothetical protein